MSSNLKHFICTQRHDAPHFASIVMIAIITFLLLVLPAYCSPFKGTAKNVWDHSLLGKVMEAKSRKYSTPLRHYLDMQLVGKIGIIGSGILGIPIMADFLSRFSSSLVPLDNLEYPQPHESVSEITIVFHGRRGPDENTEALMKAVSKTSEYVFLMDWSRFSNMFQAAYVGENIGREVARRLPPQIEKVHVIGISVGASAADACVTQLKKDRSTVYVQETLLDPVCARGLFDVDYGVREFGRSADYAQQYLNNDDSVTFSNQPTRRCAVIDVTPCRPRQPFQVPGHDWPLIYYFRDARRTGFVPDSRKLGRGVVVKIYNQTWSSLAS
jgi:hypothetical protein